MKNPVGIICIKSHRTDGNDVRAVFAVFSRTGRNEYGAGAGRMKRDAAVKIGEVVDGRM